MQLPTRSLAGALLIIIGLGFAAGCGSATGGNLRAALSSGVTDPVTITNTVVNPAELRIGDVYQTTFSGEDPTDIELEGGPDDAEYVLAVMNLSTSGGASQLSVSMGASLAAVERNVAVSDDGALDADDVEEQDLQAEFESQLRVWERESSDEETAGPVGAKAAGAEPAVRVPVLGDRESFRVLEGLSSPTRYVEVTGEARCIGERVVFYVDTAIAANSTDLTGNDLEQLCRRFDAQTVEEYALFGEPSDLNQDGRVAVLLTPQVNRLGAVGGGFVTGFFFANDLKPRTSANPVSNEREIIFVLVPDPRGQYGTPISREIALRNLIPAVLPHELQHAISYHQHVMVAGGSPEEDWLNEGLAHLAEDLMGVGVENPSRYALYLERSGWHSLVAPGSPGLVARGGIFLLLRYLYEQAGDPSAFVRELLLGREVGVANLEAAFAGRDAGFNQFAEFMLRWSVALAVNDLGLTADARYGYAARQWDAAGPHFEGVCTVCEAEDRRGTILDGVALNPLSAVTTLSSAPSTVSFYQIAASRSNVRLWARGEGGQYGVALIRVR